jgi:hypothetical protein
LLHACVVDANIISSTQPTHKDDLHIETPHELNHPCSPREVETDPKPPQISSHHVVTVEPCHQCVKPHIQPTSFQTRIRDKLFKPLNLSYHLHPYPLDFFKYFPHFSREDLVTTERHVEAFENFTVLPRDRIIFRWFFGTWFLCRWFSISG